LRKLTLPKNIRRLKKLNEARNVPVTLENLPDAAGSGAGDRVSKSASEGYTILLGRQQRGQDQPSLQVGAPAGKGDTFPPTC
jgi:hypothetical protein